MEPCSKVRYPSLPDAQRALHIVARRARKVGTTGPIGAYLCPPCRCWHLTSKSPTRVPAWMRHNHEPP